jgi:hypothetical protein
MIRGALANLASQPFGKPRKKFFKFLLAHFELSPQKLPDSVRKRVPFTQLALPNN